MPSFEIHPPPVLIRLGGRGTMFSLFVFQSRAVWKYCLQEPPSRPSQCTQQSGATSGPRGCLDKHLLGDPEGSLGEVRGGVGSNLPRSPPSPTLASVIAFNSQEFRCLGRGKNDLHQSPQSCLHFRITQGLVLSFLFKYS